MEIDAYLNLNFIEFKSSIEIRLFGIISNNNATKLSAPLHNKTELNGCNKCIINKVIVPFINFVIKMKKSMKKVFLLTVLKLQ